MANNRKRMGSTNMPCPRCADFGQKTIYLKSKEHIVRCRNCGHSWKVA